MPRRALALFAAVAAVLLCWVVGTPRNAGPDEPSHEIASAALVHGHLHGVKENRGFPVEVYDVPAMVGEPDPGCYALHEEIPASCAPAIPDSTAVVAKATTSGRYPIWGRLLPGLASFVPAPSAYVYLARLLAAAIPWLLVGAAVLRARGSSLTMAAALLLGMTPIAWFSLSIVNPSGMAIAGGAALWIALLVPRRDGATDLLLIAGWLALLLPRRDGPVWATLLVICVCLATSRLPGELWRRPSRPVRWAILLSLPIPLLPTAVDGVRGFNAALVVTPVALFAIDAAARNPAVRRSVVGHRRAAILLGIAAAGGGLAAVIVLRPGGADSALVQRILQGTGGHLRQLVGILGWLDAPVPGHAVLLWWMLVGALLSIALLFAPRLAAVAATALGLTIVTAWVLELGTGDNSGTYWQGRYSMPFVVGIPVVLAATRLRPAPLDRRLALVAGGGAWYVWNAAYIGAQRRWSVGAFGSLYPWNWHTGGVPVAPVLLITAHAVASALLVATVLVEPVPRGA